MKVSFLYTLTFLVAFLAVTGLLIISNERFNNIFRFDFSPVHTLAKSDSIVQENVAEIKTDKDTDTVVANKDSVKIAVKDSNKVTSPTVVTPPVVQENNNVAGNNKVDKKNDEVEPPVVQNTVAEIKKPDEITKASKTPDSTYNKWKKATIKIYESMDSRKVAQVIKNLTDEEARELIYAMKKKKAAEILSNLDINSVKRLTRLQ